MSVGICTEPQVCASCLRGKGRPWRLGFGRYREPTRMFPANEARAVCLPKVPLGFSTVDVGEMEGWGGESISCYSCRGLSVFRPLWRAKTHITSRHQLNRSEAWMKSFHAA